RRSKIRWRSRSDGSKPTGWLQARRDRENHRLRPTRTGDQSHSATFGSAARARAQRVGSRARKDCPASRESQRREIVMTPEANKAIALRLIEVFNGRRLDLLEDVLHP